MHLAPEFPVLTDRLCLRPLVLEDVAAVVAYRGRADVSRYIPSEPMSAEDVRQRLEGRWARRRIDAAGEALTLGVERRAAPGVIGDVMLALTSEVHRGGELGWVIHPDHSGHGYGTEAAAALLDLAFGDELDLHRVIARVDARNTASRALALRLGMREEAHLVENEWFKGEWSDEVDFALLAREWREWRERGSAQR